MAHLLRARAPWRHLVFAATILLLPLQSRAEPPADGARTRHLRSADDAVAEGRLADARDAWLGIWKLDASREAACNVGQLSVRIADMPAAAEFLTVCLRDAPEPASSEELARHERRVLDLERARRVVGALTFRVRPGADLTVDGRPVGRAPLDHEVFVEPGAHRVRAEHGADVGEVQVDVAAGQARRIVIALAPPPNRPRTWVVLTGAASSVVLVILGAGIHVAASAVETDARGLLSRPNGCFSASIPECPELLGTYEAIARARNFGSGALVVGGALAAGTLGYALFPRHTGPTLTLTGTGLQVEAAW